jgi:hypothetical protein
VREMLRRFLTVPHLLLHFELCRALQLLTRTPDHRSELNLSLYSNGCGHRVLPDRLATAADKEQDEARFLARMDPSATAATKSSHQIKIHSMMS